MRKILLFISILFLLLLVYFLYHGLWHKSINLPSRLIDKYLPNMQINVISPEKKIVNEKINLSDLKGHALLITVWSSWCLPCIQENPTLLQLHQLNKVTMIGLDYKDNAKKGWRWLNKYGDPYDIVLEDNTGDVAMEMGVYGVPESFFVNVKGIIKKKWVGALTRRKIEKELLPLLS